MQISILIAMFRLIPYNVRFISNEILRKFLKSSNVRPLLQSKRREQGDKLLSGCENERYFFTIDIGLKMCLKPFAELFSFGNYNMDPRYPKYIFIDIGS